MSVIVAYITAAVLSLGTPSQPPCEAAVQLKPSGRADAPDCAPDFVQRAVQAANAIRHRPYVWGGGHSLGHSHGYDCSGAVSYVLRRAQLLRIPRTSGALMSWGRRGRGRWITVYANAGHAYMTIGGARFDTSGPGERGPRWRSSRRSSAGFTARRP